MKMKGYDEARWAKNALCIGLGTQMSLEKYEKHRCELLNSDN